MTECIAVLGAGREQIPIMRAIIAEGYHPIGFDINPEAEGRDLCEFRNISNRDVYQMEMSLKKDAGLVGIIAAASEVAVEAAELSSRLGLPGIPVGSAMMFRDKYVMKSVMEDAGIPHTKAVLCRSSWHLEEIRKKHGDKTLVVKPLRGSGSKGVRMLRPRDDYEPEPGDFLVELYQPGPQLSTETIIWDGFVATPAIVDRHYSLTVTAPKFTEYGGSCPSVHYRRRGEITDLVAKLAKAFGIKRGTIKSDLVITDKGIKFIEATPRLSGGPLSALVKMSTGIDYFREAVKIAVGQVPSFEALITSKAEEAAVDMRGNKVPWEHTRCFIKPLPGKDVE